MQGCKLYLECGRLTLFILNMYCKGYVKYIKLCFSDLADGSADPDKMPPYAAFHQGLHCLNLYTERKGKWSEAVTQSNIQQDFGK